jgi:hypothetical protein
MFIVRLLGGLAPAATGKLLEGQRLRPRGWRHLEGVEDGVHEAVVADETGQLDEPADAVAIAKAIEELLGYVVGAELLPHVVDDVALVGRE